MRGRSAWLACSVVVFGVLAVAAPRDPAFGQQARTSWYVGEKVVCVDNGFLELSDAPELAEGAVYTVRQVLPPRRGFVGLAVDEAPAKAVFQAFDERRFRPLDLFTDRFPARVAMWRGP